MFNRKQNVVGDFIMCKILYIVWIINKMRMSDMREKLGQNLKSITLVI